MANQGAKKRKEENHRHMKNLLYLIVVCNAIYVLIRLLIFHSTFTWKHWIGLVITSMAYGLSYQQLSLMAKPTYSDEGELLDGGFDMNTGGVCGYLHDVIYITCFVQLMSTLSGKFWYTYLVVKSFLWKQAPCILGWLPCNIYAFWFYSKMQAQASMYLAICLEMVTDTNHILVPTFGERMRCGLVGWTWPSAKVWYAEGALCSLDPLGVSNFFVFSQIPAFGLYKLFDASKGFLFQGSESAVEEDEKSRKKREKMEKRASRPKLVRTRYR